jgi:hypothetical protein
MKGGESMDAAPTARIHLLPAKEAPYVIIIRRKPSKTFHIIRWNVEHDEFEHGSWFTGHIYAHRSDVSFDGKWMVYFASGASGDLWNGVCLLPYLKTYLEANAADTWGGGGFWIDSQTISTDSWGTTKGAAPFRHENGRGGNRMERDGWIPSEYKESRLWQFYQRGATLEAIYSKRTTDFEFRLREFPALLDKEVEWATFASNGDLVFTRRGPPHKAIPRWVRQQYYCFYPSDNESCPLCRRPRDI